MRAVGYEEAGSIDREDALLDVVLPDPVPSGRQLLVEIKAISVNPVDTKVRKTNQPPSGTPKVLGWDAAGVVRSIGSDVSLFKVGDAVFYAGALGEPGTNAELHLVDERIVGVKPKSLDWANSAAMPLTSITAWEALFDRLNVQQAVPGGAPAVLIIGGGGGVASIAIQLARQLTELTVIGTASRPETHAWVSEMGAHHVIDHSQPMAPQIAALGLAAPSFVFSTTQTGQHLADIAELIAPQGRFALIDDPKTLDVNAFKRKSASVHWEFMFTRSMYGTADISEQGRLLNQVSRLLDEGKLRSTMTQQYSPINAQNLKEIHVLLESGKARGKIVATGF